MKRFLLGSFLAAVVLFVFGAAFWTCPIPYAYVEKPSSSNEALGAALREHLPNDGLYLVPGNSPDPELTARLYRSGPIATIHYQREGAEVFDPLRLFLGFLHGWVTTAILALLLRLAPLPRFGQRLTVVTLAGLAAANYMVLGAGIYWHQPWPWLILNASFNTAAMLVAGLVLAVIVKPAAATNSANAAR
ncbi:MAG: hypothetical protein J0M24_10400 [Verrucomicrobia bacterium]|jgi:hypothetical protein|nr:hypothetical protein [Verrucomicrobiota bacterium]